MLGMLGADQLDTAAEDRDDTEEEESFTFRGGGHATRWDRLVWRAVAFGDALELLTAFDRMNGMNGRGNDIQSTGLRS